MSTLESATDQHAKKPDATKPPPPPGSDHVEHPHTSPETTGLTGHNLADKSLSEVRSLQPKDQVAAKIENGKLVIPPLGPDGKPVEAAVSTDKPATPATQTENPATGDKTVTGTTTPEAPKTPDKADPNQTPKDNTLMSTVSGIWNGVKTATYDATAALVGKTAADVAASAVDTAGNVVGQLGTSIWDSLGSQAITKTDGINTLNVDLAKNIVGAQAAADTYATMGKKIGEAFGPSTPGAAPDKQFQALDQERNQLAQGHKPGDNWTDKSGTVYSLDKNNDLLIYKNANDITWVGQNGKSYEKRGDVETWRNDGREIKSTGDKNYTYTDAQGKTTELDGKKAEVFHNIHDLQVTQYNQLRQKLTAEEVVKLGEGVTMHANGMAVIESDDHGNFLAKDSMQHGELIVHTGPDGKPQSEYRVRDGQVYSLDSEGKETKLDKLPDFLKRNQDGSLQFGDIKINKNDTIHEGKHDLTVADRETKFTAEQGKVQGSVDVAHGTQDLSSQGEFKSHSVFNAQTHESTYNQTDWDGRPEFNYDFNKSVMNSEGITFTPEGSHIAGTDFAIRTGGERESAAEWRAHNAAAGISSSETTGDLSDGSSGDTSTNGSPDGSTDAAQTGQNGDNPDGSQTADANPDQSQNPDDSNAAFNKELTASERWDHWREKIENGEFREADTKDREALGEQRQDAITKARENARNGNLIELPEAWKQKGMLAGIDRGAVLGAIGDVMTGHVTTGDIAALEDAKDKIADASVKFGSSSMAWAVNALSGLESRATNQAVARDSITSVGGTGTEQEIRDYFENGGGGAVVAAKIVAQDEQRATA